MRSAPARTRGRGRRGVTAGAFGKRFLVTGAAGFVGRRLCAILTAQGAHVTALVHRTPLPYGGIRPAIGDLTTAEGMRGVRAAADGAEYVIHLAAVVKSRSCPGYWRCNAEGTANLARILAAAPLPPRRLVLCSSLAAAGPSLPGRPRTEDDPPAPVSHYGRSKLAGEQAVRKCADRLGAVVIRPPIVYGPGDPAFLPTLLPMVRKGLVLKAGVGPKRYSLIHVDDLCAALLAATERGTTMRSEGSSSGVYSVSDGQEYTWQRLCRTAADVMGYRPPLLIPVPHTVTRAVAIGAEAAGRLRGTVPALNRDKVRELNCAAWACSSARAGQDLGFTPSIQLPEGIASFLAATPPGRKSPPGHT
ncbi:short-chain dehydrogenase [Streptomyces griseocarneus]|nr:short-chain dehydrogenase [Streptomyces griseocarneus]